MLETLPEVLVGAVLDFVPRRSLVEFALCSHSSNQTVVEYGVNRLAKSELGKSFIRRHIEGTTAERGNFSPAYLLFCVVAAPENGAYFCMKEIRGSFNKTMQSIYPDDLYQRGFHVVWGRILFVIDGIAVYESVEGCTIGRWRFVVCRCPLPQLIQSFTANTVQAWTSGGRVYRQAVVENLWERGWTMYDHVERDLPLDESSDEEEDDEAAGDGEDDMSDGPLLVGSLRE